MSGIFWVGNFDASYFLGCEAHVFFNIELHGTPRNVYWANLF